MAQQQSVCFSELSGSAGVAHLAVGFLCTLDYFLLLGRRPGLTVGSYGDWTADYLWPVCYFSLG